MKTLAAILSSLLLVLSSGLTLAASTDAVEAPICHGCGCATAACCSAPDDAGSEQPALPPVPEKRGGSLKILALRPASLKTNLLVVTVGRVPSPSACERAVADVPRYLLNCRLLI